MHGRGDIMPRVGSVTCRRSKFQDLVISVHRLSSADSN